MRVKVHPHKTLVDANEEACVSITPMKKHGRAYYMGTVFLSGVSFTVHESEHARALRETVRNVHAWVIGDNIFEATEQYWPGVLDKGKMIGVEYVLDAGRFIAEDGVDVTDGAFNAAVLVGKNLFITHEWKDLTD